MVSFNFDPVYAGSAIQAYNLSRALVRLGVEPILLAARLTDSPRHEDYHGIPLYRLPVFGGTDLQRFSFWASLLPFLVSMRGRYNIIHAHGTGAHAILGLLGRLLRTPTILKVAMAGSDLNFGRQGRTLGPLNRALVKQFSCYIATTDAIANEFAAEGLDASRVRLVPNGVDTEMNRPLPPEARERLRQELGLPPGPLVTTVGIVIARKNVDGALRSFHAAISRGAPGHFLVIGPMPEDHADYHRELRAFIDAHGIGDRVSFLGLRSPVAPYLQASDVFIFPSRREGMPNSVLEAMACGLPCIVSGSAGIETSVITHGRNGFAIDVDDDETFAATLERLLRDPELRADIGAAARETIVGRFSLDAIASQYRDLYSELLGRTPAPARSAPIATSPAGGSTGGLR